MFYFFLYETSTGIIQQPPIQAVTNPWPNPPSSWSVASFATTDTTAILAAANPAWYLVQSGALVIQPHWLVTATASTTTSGEYSLSATLENPPATPPSTCAFAVAGGTLSATVSNNTATATIQLHASVASQPVTVQVSASGTVSGSTTINSGTAGVGLQLVTSGTTPLVAPAGTGSLAYLRQTAFGLTTGNLIGLLVQSLQALMATSSSVSEFLVNVVIPAITQTTWAAADISAYQAAIASWQKNVVPNQVAWTDLLDAQGNPVQGYTDLQTLAPMVLDAWNTYNTWASEVPNLS